MVAHGDERDGETDVGMNEARTIDSDSSNRQKNNARAKGSSERRSKIEYLRVVTAPAWQVTYMFVVTLT